MEIYNTTTKRTDTLTHRFNNNVGDLIADDPNITVNPETQKREASQDTIDFWILWLGADEDYHWLYEAAKDELECDEILRLDDELLESSLGIEFNDQGTIQIRVIESFLKELGFDLTHDEYPFFKRREVSVA